MVETLIWLEEECPGPPELPATILYDSQYALSMITGKAAPDVNLELVHRARKVYTRVSRARPIDFTYVKGIQETGEVTMQTDSLPKQPVGSNLLRASDGAAHWPSQLVCILCLLIIAGVVAGSFLDLRTQGSWRATKDTVRYQAPHPPFYSAGRDVVSSSPGATRMPVKARVRTMLGSSEISMKKSAEAQWNSPYAVHTALRNCMKGHLTR